MWDVRQHGGSSESSRQSDLTASIAGAYQAIISGSQSVGAVTLFSEAQTEPFKNLVVERGGAWNYYGRADSARNDLQRLVREIGPHPVQSADCLVESICAVASSTALATERDFAWITIRSFFPESVFVARWHSDGLFFTSESADEVQVKIAFAPLGRATLAAELDLETRARFQTVQRGMMSLGFELSTAEGERKESLKRLEREIQRELNEIVTPERIIPVRSPLEGVIFSVGRDDSGFHSEPPIDSPRIFVSVVPGSESQIGELETRFPSTS